MTRVHYYAATLSWYVPMCHYSDHITGKLYILLGVGAAALDSGCTPVP